MPRCRVLGCTVGYDSNSDKGPFLTAPRDSKTLDAWKKATKLPTLKTGDPICHNHFRPDEVITHKVLECQGKIMKIPLKHVR